VGERGNRSELHGLDGGGIIKRTNKEKGISEACFGPGFSSLNGPKGSTTKKHLSLKDSGPWHLEIRKATGLTYAGFPTRKLLGANWKKGEKKSERVSS